MTEQREHWLSSEDFDALDKLIGRHGFGGYYDLLDVLKTIIKKIDLLNNLKPGWKKEIKSLPEAVGLLSRLADRL